MPLEKAVEEELLACKPCLWLVAPYMCRRVGNQYLREKGGRLCCLLRPWWEANACKRARPLHACMGLVDALQGGRERRVKILLSSLCKLFY